MMSKKQWFVLLCFFVVYLLLGAAIFYIVESNEENRRMQLEADEKREIEAILKSYMNSNVEHTIFQKLSIYCGKPIQSDMSSIPYERKWDFYHTLFFVITVVSTIGYGNLAPTTPFSRTFMIFYGLIGIPMNGIVMVTLGGFFSKSFTKLYRRWKISKMEYETTRLGLITQVLLYLIPGFAFFIFMPAVIMSVFEDWPYDVAVYFAFVTLTTIGFGDYVPGIEGLHGYPEWYFTMYQIFLLIWVMGGIGYVLMVLNFITQAMRSKKIKEFEQLLTQNLRKTPTRIRQELRTLLLIFLKMKPEVLEAAGHFDYIPKLIERSRSCPDLTIYQSSSSTSGRKRAYSECPKFQYTTPSEQLLLQMVDALIDNEMADNGGSGSGGGGGDGYNCFSDMDILQSEQIVSSQSRTGRQFAAAAATKTQYNSNMTWYGVDPRHQLQKCRNRLNSVPCGDYMAAPPLQSWPHLQQSTTVPAAHTSNAPVAEQSITIEEPALTSSMQHQQQNLLENTSVADLIRAISAVSAQPTLQLSEAMATTRTRRVGLNANLVALRRTSLMPKPKRTGTEARRFSLRPVDEHAPPPYSKH